MNGLRTAVVFVFALGLAVAVAHAASGEGEEPAPAERPVKTIKLYVEKWKWSPDQIRVPKGTHVVLTIESFDGSRKFELKEYGLSVKLPRGETVKVEFDADRVGEFRWRCARPCGDGCAKLRGTLIVYE